eukprot:m.176054 g.176054  ORF g.176054 m.176054 type:complete len:188 (-) comp17933_c0_seq2:56-619(-)
MGQQWHGCLSSPSHLQDLACPIPVDRRLSQGEGGFFFCFLGCCVFRLQTTVPVNAPVGGTLTQIFVEEGETVVVGAKLFEINSDGSEPAGGDSEAPGAAAEEPSASQAPETADTPDSETPSAASGQRTASVQFPRRRDEHGNPLVPLSLEFFHKGPAGVVEEYSDSFARKPIDEEEIEIINAGGAWD